VATITKRLSFENLLPYASMGIDSDGDGVVDGWRKFGSMSATTSWLFDEEEKAQMINIVDTADVSNVAVENDQYIPVTAGVAYTFSAYMRMEGELPPESGGKLIIMWYDEASPLGLMGSNESGVFVDADYTRHSLTATAPTGALFAKVRIEFHASTEQISGTLWTKWAQFQEGNTATDYEETDFFEIINPAADATGGYSYGWEKTSAKKFDGLYSYRTVSQGTSPTIAIRFRTPPNAENVQFRAWIDTTEIATGDRLTFWDGGSLLGYLSEAAQGRTVWVPIRRGEIFMMIQLSRSSPPNGTAYIDAFEVSWEETAPNPSPEPPTADRVYSIDFENETYDPFFAVKEQADGYNYGFTRRYDYRNSGFYSLGVKDNDVPDVNYPENGSPPTIPEGEKAACSFSFRVPISAIDPVLELYVNFDADPNGNIARIIINGAEEWSTNQRNGWEKLSFPLVPGMSYLVIVEFEKAIDAYSHYTDAVYIDDVVVYYNIPDRPFMYVATAPQTEIRVGTGETFSITEDFESTVIDSFFTVQNPSKLKSGGGPSQYPEAGWVRTTKIAYQGSYSFRAQREKTKNNEDAAVDFIFKVPHGVKNAKAEWWNFVELERSPYPLSGEKYPKLYEEYRIWVNYSLWKEFNHCSPNLTTSVKYTTYDDGDPGNDYACPWGVWWKETLPLTPGRTYTLTFELQRDSGDSSDIHGRDLCCIDNLTVSWEETPGDVVTVPPQPLIYFDGRDGFKYVDDRSGAEMAPLSFAEYRVFGQAGSVHQFTQVDPRMIDFSLLITGENRDEIRQKMRELTTKLSNRPLTLIVVYPEGEERQINCRLADILGRERMGEQGPGWKKVVLSFRAFDPFWYGERIVVDGAGPENAGYFPTEVMVKNPGDAEAWPIFKLYGPITNPQVQLVDPNNDLNIYAEFKLTGFTIPAGRYVVVDTRPGRKTIIFDDGQNLYQFLDPSINQLFSIPPGEYVVDLDGGSTDANTKIVVEFQPPYWGV